MKLRFKAEARDVMIFILYLIVLFYLVSIAVVNSVSFISDGTLKGLNPLPAYTGGYFAPTMVFYLIAVIASFAGVQSYFFEREKGIGFGVGSKSEKGYSRWLKEKEMKKELKRVLPGEETSEAAGIPLINNGKEIWVDDSSYHSIIMGSTGSGKTETLVQPMVKILAKAGESMIITDPKGEIYVNVAEELKSKGYEIILLNFRDPQNGNCWNPLNLPYSLYKAGNSDKATELLDDLAKNILYDESNKAADPFWENTAADYFAGLSLTLFEDAKEEEINLNSINLMATVGEEKIGGTLYMKEYFSDKDQSSPAYINVSSTLSAPNETKGSILSVFHQKIKLFSSRANLSEMLSHSDFNMDDIGRKKTAVFIVVQDEKKTYHSLVTIFLKQCYETLIRVAQENGGKLAYRTNFILDEFANMPPLKDVTTMVSAARSRKIRFNFMIQNFSQLYDVYGKEQGETIKGNCGNIIYLISSEMGALEEISKMCGEVKSKKDEKTSSTPLITVSDLQRLPMGNMIVIRSRMFPFKAKMTHDAKMIAENAWGKNYPKADFPKREKQEVHIFDLKKVVEAKRQKKIDEMIGSAGKGMPNMPGLFGPSKPEMGMSKPSMPGKKKPGFNVDDIVKRIDAKIAELEEEERLEKEAKAKASAKKVIEEPKEEKIVEEKKTVKPSISEVSMPKNIETKEITDDQFFDDFFSDDE